MNIRNLVGILWILAVLNSDAQIKMKATIWLWDTNGKNRLEETTKMYSTVFLVWFTARMYCHIQEADYWNNLTPKDNASPHHCTHQRDLSIKSEGKRVWCLNNIFRSQSQLLPGRRSRVGQDPTELVYHKVRLGSGDQDNQSIVFPCGWDILTRERSVPTP